jgi:hypothetical protein
MASIADMLSKALPAYTKPLLEHIERIEQAAKADKEAQAEKEAALKAEQEREAAAKLLQQQQQPVDPLHQLLSQAYK